MAVQWTEQQAAAIENRGGTLLVSAAAGSGKTAVLVERILRRITDPHDPQDIDRFLIVTFTKAAAAEMRAKIADALSSLAAQQPENARLRRQLMLVHRAPITTVHAWCMGLVREHFHDLGLAPDFRTAEESEQEAIRAEVLEETLEALYQSEQPDFEYLADVLSTGRDDRRMAQVILDTFRVLQSSANPRAVLRSYREAYAAPFDRFADTAWGRELLGQAEAMCRYGMQLLSHALDAMETEQTVREKYHPAFAHDLQCANTLLTLVQDGAWDAAVAYAEEIRRTRMRLGAVRGYEDKAFLERLKDARNMWKKLSDDLTKNILCLTEAEIREDIQRMKPAVYALCDAVQTFSDAYEAEKRRRNVVDFSDLEHFAVQLLQDEEGHPTALAREMHFAEIMVDEYQDTNDVQDAIFRAVSDDENNIFMVGDVKQSIYRFRMAEPRIFLKRYQSYQDAQQVQDNAPRRIVLSKNFRSRASVLELTNFLFSAVMSERLGDLAYTDREALYLGADYPEGTADYDAELCILETGGNNEEEQEAPEKIALEADYCAMRAAQMLESRYPVYDHALKTFRPCTPSDIVILLRSVKNRAPVFQHALEARGVPAAAEASDGILQTPEVLTLCAYLAIIDNPRQDIPLLAVLRSPLVGWSEQQLARVRMTDMESDYYTALCASDLPEAKTFLQQLARLRLLAADLPVQRLLWMVLDETNAIGIYGAMPGGALRQRNLTALLEAAGAFERTTSRGLFAFVRYLRDLRAQEKDITSSSAGESGGFVRIMTIHKSKGLEFPIVILADCAKQFNRTDLTQSVLLHRNMGIGMKCCDLERGVRYRGVDHRALASILRREMISEELRVLYVALTRAKEKLIITCALPNPARTIAQWSALAMYERLPEYALAAAGTPAMWLIVPMLRHPNAEALRECCPELPPLDPNAPKHLRVQLISYHDIDVQTEQMGLHQDKADDLPPIPEEYSYPVPELAQIPSKLTATALTGSFRAQEAQQGTAHKAERTLRRPFFDQAKRGLTPSEIGTAHHMFLQFADFAACIAGNIAEEIARLVDNHTLTKQQGDALDCAKLSRFFTSSLMKEMQAAHNLRREFKFSVLVPAGDYYPEVQQYPEEQALLQGVVDCMYETGDGIVIVDFKTDRVSGTAAVKRAEQYRGQLHAYARAVQLVFGKPVIRCVLFFLQAGECVVWRPEKNMLT